MFLSPLNGYVKMSPYSVSNDNFVQWGGGRFQIPSQPQRFSFAGAKVQLYESLGERVAIYYGDTEPPRRSLTREWHFHVATTLRFVRAVRNEKRMCESGAQATLLQSSDFD
jgi:hypothetical protein